MTIAYTIPSITNSGGMERTLSIKANYLVNKGYKVHIITTLVSKEKPFFHFDSKIQFHSTNLSSDNVKKKSLTVYLERLSTILSEIQPDISISMNVGHCTYLYKINDGSKKILESHFSKFKRKNRFYKLEKIKWLKWIPYLYIRKKTHTINQYDKFVVLTQEDKNDWGNLYNIEVIPNMIPPIYYPENINYSNKKIIGVGRLTGQKGWGYMIKAWALIAKNNPNWKVTIYGNGHKRKALQKLINKYHINNSFKLHFPAKNITEKFEKSSIFVSTSRYEGQSMVILEAMNSGLPVISFMCKCGPRDMISHGENGYLIELYDIKSFAYYLQKLIDSKEKRKTLGKQAKNSLTEYSEKNIMNKWVNLFDQLVSRPRRSLH